MGDGERLQLGDVRTGRGCCCCRAPPGTGHGAGADGQVGGVQALAGCYCYEAEEAAWAASREVGQDGRKGQTAGLAGAACRRCLGSPRGSAQAGPVGSTGSTLVQVLEHRTLVVEGHHRALLWVRCTLVLRRAQQLWTHRTQLQQVLLS